MKAPILAIAAIGNLVMGTLAQRPQDQPICDFYTQALFSDNSEENQAKLLTALVNRVVIGNFTPTATNVAVSGILAPADFKGQRIEFLPFFTGQSGPTTNVGGVATAGINFLDDGGAEPLKRDLPANGRDSRQFLLLTHLYSLFGSLMGCTRQGGQVFPNYEGNPSMFETHKFMNLNKIQMDFFNDQVGQAALSFGVSQQDAQIVGTALENLFNARCNNPVQLTPRNQQALQAFCLGDGCPLGNSNNCPIGGNAGGGFGGGIQGGIFGGGVQGGFGGQILDNLPGTRKVLKCVPRNINGGVFERRNDNVFDRGNGGRDQRNGRGGDRRDDRGGGDRENEDDRGRGGRGRGRGRGGRGRDDGRDGDSDSNDERDDGRGRGRGRGRR